MSIVTIPPCMENEAPRGGQKPPCITQFISISISIIISIGIGISIDIGLSH